MINEVLEHELEARLRATFDEMIPKLIDVAPSMERSPVVEFELRARHTPQRSLRRIAIAGLVAAASVVGLAVIKDRSANDLPPASGSNPAVSDNEPDWFVLLRPFVPDRFGFLAITDATENAATFVAIDASDGKALEIALSDSDADDISDSEGTSDSIGSWRETPQGWVVITPAGLRAEVSCDIGVKGRDFAGPPNYCEMASTDAFTKSEIRAVAAAVTTSQVIETARNQSLVQPAYESGVGDLIATALPDQQLIGDTTWGSGDHVWDFALDPTRPDTSVRVITGAYPRPAARVVPTLALYDDAAAAFWTVDPSGVAVRVSTTDPQPGANLDHLLAVAASVADHVIARGQDSPGETTSAIAEKPAQDAIADPAGEITYATTDSRIATWPALSTSGAPTNNRGYGLWLCDDSSWTRYASLVSADGPILAYEGTLCTITTLAEPVLARSPPAPR